MSGKEHKAYVAEVFGRTAERYDRVGSPLFVPLGRRQPPHHDPAAVATLARHRPARLHFPPSYVAKCSRIGVAPRLAAAAERPRGAAPVDTRVMDAERLDPDLLKRFGLEPRRLMAGSPDPEAELAKAGFGGLSATVEDFDISFADAGEWWEWAWAMPHRAVFEAMEEPARERFRTAALEALRTLGEAAGGIRLHAQARYVIGRKPG